jgi:hypothetical protein
MIEETENRLKDKYFQSLEGRESDRPQVGDSRDTYSRASGTQSQVGDSRDTYIRRSGEQSQIGDSRDTYNRGMTTPGNVTVNLAINIITPDLLKRLKEHPAVISRLQNTSDLTPEQMQVIKAIPQIAEKVNAGNQPNGKTLSASVQEREM